MCCQCVIRKRIALADQIQIRFAGFEENLNLPSFAIDPDDLFRRKFHVCTNETDPVFLVLLIADAYDTGRNLFFLSDHNVNREKIFTAAPALFVDAINLLDGELLTVVFITDS